MKTASSLSAQSGALMLKRIKSTYTYPTVVPEWKIEYVRQTTNWHLSRKNRESRWVPVDVADSPNELASIVGQNKTGETDWDGLMDHSEASDLSNWTKIDEVYFEEETL